MATVKVTVTIKDFLDREFPCYGVPILRYFPDITLIDSGYDIKKLDWDGCLVSRLERKIKRFYNWRRNKTYDVVNKKALLLVYEIFDEIGYYVRTGGYKNE